ncbi:MAG: ABC transporter permease, partial [Chloroflexota bacterium]
LDEVERLCDRVAVMSAGRVRACGSMADLRGVVAPRERYQLQVRGWSPEIQTEIEDRVPDLAVDSLGEQESLLEFSVYAGDDLNQIIDVLRGHGGSIQSLSRERASLDDIFDQITTGVEHDNWLRDESETTGVSLPETYSEAASFYITGTLSELWRVARAFLKRDLRSEMSYRFSFFLQFFNVFFSVAVFYFVAQLLGEAATPYLEPYGGDYFSFVLIGIAFAGYFGVGLSSFSNSLRTAQTTGTLEAMLCTPTRLSAIILSSSQWSYLMTTLRVIVYLLIGTVFLGVDIGQGNYLAAVLILVLTVISFSSLGIIAASFIMVLKRGDPVAWIFGTLSSLLGGVYYPLAVMPEWMQALSHLLPVTYALRAMRLALLQGASFSELMPDILALGAFCVILLPVSLLAFGYAVKWARRDGSLTHY